MKSNPNYYNYIIYILSIIALLSCYKLIQNVPFLTQNITNSTFDYTSNIFKEETTFMVTNRQNELKLISQNIKVNKNSDYLIEFEIDEIEGNQNGILRIDFMAEGYDTVNQEHVIYLNSDIQEKKFSFIINSGKNAPNQANFRIFYEEPLKIKISHIAISKFNKFYYILKYSILICLLILIILVIYDIYKLNKILANAIVFSAITIIICKIIITVQSGDSMWNVPTTLSILREGNIDLNEYLALIKEKNNYGIFKVGKMYYNYFPIGMPLITMLFVFIGNILFTGDFLKIEIFSAMVLFAFTNFFFFILSNKLTKSLVNSYILTAIFAFATSNFHIMSGGLWTHGGVEIMLILALLFITKGIEEKNDIWIVFSAMPLAMTYIVRPTSSVFIIILSIYILLAHRKAFLKYCILGSMIAAIFFVWSFRIYGHFLPPYYQGSRLAFNTFWIALLGQSFSPNRGLFIFTPIFLFSMYGIKLAFKHDMFSKFLAISPLPYFFVLAMFPHWWGGHSYGARLFTDLIPFFTLLLVYPLQKINFKQNKIYSVCFTILLLFSLFVQIRAVTDFSVHLWNNTPNMNNNIDQYPERIWDWKDMQIFRGLIRGE